VCSRKNYVNLGRFYSIPPWRTPKTISVRNTSYNNRSGLSTQNTVNLGNLYTHSPRLRSSGYAFFEDGSIWISGREYEEHDVFEAEMKLLQPFVRGPSPKLEQVRKTYAERQRLIVTPLSKQNGSDYTVFARSARDEEQIIEKAWPLEQIDFEIDASRSRLLSAKVHQSPIYPSLGHKRNLGRSLWIFRGTLVAGILQPWTRLGNGLKLSTPKMLQREESPTTSKEITPRRRESTPKARKVLVDKDLKPSEKPMLRRSALSKREAELVRREQQLLLLQQQLLQNAATAPLRMVLSTDPGTSRTAELKAKERELQHQEQMLKWKRKAFLLEQKLAARTRDPQIQARTSNRRSRRRLANSDEKATTPPTSGTVDDPPEEAAEDTNPGGKRHDAYGDLFDQYRRTRIKLPGRGGDTPTNTTELSNEGATGDDASVVRPSS
jgi:hypothetical protein